MAHIRSIEVVESALRDFDAGVPDLEDARRHGVTVPTIRRWRRLYQCRGQPRGQAHLSARCPRCEKASLDSSAYAELLGWYLGDGHISRGRRDVYALHIFNDERYPELNDHVMDLMRLVEPASRPHTRHLQGRLNITVSWKHWPCLFPQHGPGRKHLRTLELEDWQREIVESEPGGLPAGPVPLRRLPGEQLAQRMVAGEMKRYDYPRWQFVNHSPADPPVVLRGAGPRRRALAALELEDRVGLHPGRCGPARRADRPEAVRADAGALGGPVVGRRHLVDRVAHPVDA